MSGQHLEHTQRSHPTIGALLSDVFRISSSGSQSALLRAGAPREAGRCGSRFDLVTEAANLRRLVLHSAGMMGARAVVLRHAYPVTDGDDRALEESALLLARHCCGLNPSLPDLDFVADAVRNWAERPMRATYPQHAERLGYTRAHLEFKIAKGQCSPRSAPSVRVLMGSIYVPAVSRIEQALERRGIVWH